MALVALTGTGLYVPPMSQGIGAAGLAAASDSLILDADEEEAQLIGRVVIDGYGSKTFGGGSSTLGWLPGASITFNATSTLRVGVKQASDISTTAGGPARATIGAAAFDVYHDLVGGTDTITSITWREDAMDNGTLGVAHGDLIAVCFHLNKVSGTSSIKIRQSTPITTPHSPQSVLVTTGPTYTAQNHLTNCVLTFSDGTIGWLDGSHVFSVEDVVTSTVGENIIVGNIITLPFPCKIDAIMVPVKPSTNAADFAVVVYGDPSGTPSLLESVSVDANTLSAVNTLQLLQVSFDAPLQLSANTSYVFGVKQTTATAFTTLQHEVSTASYFKVEGMGAESYAVTSNNGAAFTTVSATQRYRIAARISHLSDGVTAGGVKTMCLLGTGL